MANFKLTCLILQTTIIPIYSFFYESPINVFNRPSTLQENSYFGYSMAYYNETLVVSAPAADKFGKVFLFHLTKNVIGEINSPTQSYYTSESDWFGATVKSYGSTLVVCAPRFLVNRSKMRTTKGQCLKCSEAGCFTLQTISDANRQLFNYYIDSFGWSVDIDESMIWIGSPAVPANAIMIYNESAMYVKYAETKEFNYGYSIVSGNFLLEKKTSHAVSSTYRNYGSGQVVIIDEKLQNSFLLPGKRPGSMFGATLCKANLGYTRAALLVGAPTFVSDLNKYDRGAVYLYVPHSLEPLKLKRIIKGEVDAGYFGHAIATIGDLDGDQRDEVAIGAPFEDDGKGAVYIYSGAGLLADAKWSQKMSPENTHFFGYNLASLPDSYKNGLNELAVSSLNDHAYIFEALPSITVHLDVYFPNLQMRENTTYFDFRIVVNVSYPKKAKKISSKLVVKTMLRHPHAKLLNSTSNGIEVNLFSLEPQQKNYNITSRVLTPVNGDYNQVVPYSILVNLQDEPEKKGKINRGQVLLSEWSVISKNGTLWMADCIAVYGQCTPKLEVSLSTTIIEPYTVGSSDKELVSFSILNSGETAYSPCVAVKVVGVRVLRLPTCCVFDENNIDQIICKPELPVRNGDKWDTGNIELEMNSLTGEDEQLIIVYNISKNCNNDTDKTKYVKTLMFVHDTNIQITGLAIPNEFVNMTDIDIQHSTQLQHQYTITNKGVTNWVDAKCEIVLQKKDYLRYTNIYIWIHTLMIECLPEKGKSNEDFLTFLCIIRDFRKNQIVQLFIYIETLPNTLGDIIKYQNVSVPTNVTLILKKYSTKSSITTTLVFSSATVPTWIIFIALLIGLLIIMLIGFILYKCKCFERKNKKKLENLKRASVHMRKRSENRITNIGTETAQEEFNEPVYDDVPNSNEDLNEALYDNVPNN